jgi:hypothetical protein
MQGFGHDKHRVSASADGGQAALPVGPAARMGVGRFGGIGKYHLARVDFHPSTTDQALIVGRRRSGIIEPRRVEANGEAPYAHRPLWIAEIDVPG